MSANDPIVVIDVEGHYLDANEAACNQLGYTRAELLSTTALQINGLTAEAWRRTVAETLRLGSRVVETGYHCRDGAVVPMEASIRAVVYQGRPAFLSVARNIERRKRAEAELVRRNIELATVAAGATRHAQSLAVPAPSPQGTNATFSLDMLLPAFAERARSLVAFDNAAIALYVSETQQFVLRLTHGDGVGSFPAALTLCAPAYLDLLREGQPVLLPDGDAPRNLGLAPASNGHSQDRSGMALPLFTGKRLMGVLSVGRHEGPEFRLADADLLRPYADQLSLAIDSSYLLEGIRTLAVTEERNRLGREMHDRIGQALAGATAYSAVAAEMLERGQAGRAAQALGEVSKALQEAYADLRDAIYALRSADVTPEDWVESLQQYARRYEQQWGIRCDLQVGDGVATACGAQGRQGLTRILQEALTNVRKHTQSRQVWVSVRLEDGSVLASVTDEGRGFNPAEPAQGHYGLETMRERACSLGGELRIASDSSGTQVSVRVPAHYAA